MTQNANSLTRREMLKLTGGALLGTALPGYGCSSSDKNTVTLMTAMSEPKDRSLKRLVDEFSEMHPTIHVEHTAVPWAQSHSKILTIFAGGKPPDLLTVSTQWMAEFRAMGAIEDLTPWFQNWAYKEAHTDMAVLRSKIATAREEDNVYGLPIETTVRAMFYRKDWLDELGLEPAMTRDEWRTICERMTDPQKNRYGYSFRGANRGFLSWWAMSEEFAGTNEWFDEDHRCIINSPEYVQGLEFWNALYQDGLVPKDSLNWGYSELVQAFWAGITGCFEQDPEVVRTCYEHGMDETTFTTAIMPAGPKARVSVADVWFMSMTSGSPRKDAAWEVLSWLMAPEQVIRHCKEVGMIPPVKQGINDPAFGQGLYKPFMDMVNDPTMLSSWYPSYLPEMGEFIEVRTTEEQQKMLLKQQSPQETLDKLADFMTAAQKKYIDKNGPDTPRPPK
jgi:multiple sugar transport system substrate-binding protein